MQPRIELLPEKKLVGRSLKMSLANDRTFELWSGFIPKRKLIKNIAGTDLYSLQVYSELPDFKKFSPDTQFEKWALVEVTEFEDGLAEFETFLLQAGLYAVFVHKGTTSDFHKTIKTIYVDWLPGSDYELDDRPHFEVLGEKYKNDHPDSEEEVWIPVTKAQ
mgnify:CR=1 FL=1